MNALESRSDVIKHHDEIFVQYVTHVLLLGNSGQKDDEHSTISVHRDHP